MNWVVLSTMFIIFLGLLVVAVSLPCHRQKLYGASTDPSAPVSRWQYEPLHGWSDPSSNGQLNFVVSYNSVNYAFLAAISMCQWRGSSASPMAWQDLPSAGYHQCWALKKKATAEGSALVDRFLFCNTQTFADLQNGATKRPNFVAKAYVSISATSVPPGYLYQMDGSIGAILKASMSMNQGTGLGNMIGTSSDLAELYLSLSAGRFFKDKILNDFTRSYSFFNYAPGTDAAVFSADNLYTPSLALMSNIWAGAPPMTYGCGGMQNRSWWDQTLAANATYSALGLPTFSGVSPATSFLVGHGGDTNGFCNGAWVLEGKTVRTSCSVLVNMEDAGVYINGLTVFAICAKTVSDQAMNDASLAKMVDLYGSTWSKLHLFPSGGVVSIAVIVETLEGARIAAYSADYAKAVEPKTPAMAEFAFGSLGSKLTTALNAACIVQDRANAATAQDLVKATFRAGSAFAGLTDSVTDKTFCCFQAGQKISGGDVKGIKTQVSAAINDQKNWLQRLSIGQLAWMQSGLGDIPSPDFEVLDAYASIAFGPAQWISMANVSSLPANAQALKPRLTFQQSIDTLKISMAKT